MKARKYIALLCLLFVLGVFVVTAWPRIEFWMLTGHFFPITIVETLDEPVAVTGWSSEGLMRSDGGIILLPELDELPEKSEALSRVIQSGVEVTSDGRVYGSLQIHHWCGNDPVREHIARIDIARLLQFLGQGKPVHPEMTEQYAASGGSFSEWGWNVSGYCMFLEWCKFVELIEAKDPKAINKDIQDG